MIPYSRQDLETHSVNGHWGEKEYPAVKIKVYGSLSKVRFPLDLGTVNGERIETDPAFTLEWIEDNLSESELDSVFWDCCNSEVEYLSEYAKEVFGSRVKVSQSGRSGGWLVLQGIGHPEEWDTIAIGKYLHFENVCNVARNSVWQSVAIDIYLNYFEPKKEEGIASLESRIISHNPQTI